MYTHVLYIYIYIYIYIHICYSQRVLLSCQQPTFHKFMKHINVSSAACVVQVTC